VTFFEDGSTKCIYVYNDKMKVALCSRRNQKRFNDHQKISDREAKQSQNFIIKKQAGN